MIAEPIRQIVILLLVAFLIVQGIVVLQLLLTVQRYVAPDAGPEVGRWIPRLSFQTIDARAVVIGGNQRVSVLMFVGPTCSACHAMIPSLRQLVRENTGVDVIFFAAGGDESRNREFAQELRAGIADTEYVVLPTPRVRVQEFGVRSVPYLIVLDAAGVIAGRGYIPSRERLDKVVESTRVGLRSPLTLSPMAASEPG